MRVRKIKKDFPAAAGASIETVCLGNKGGAWEKSVGGMQFKQGVNQVKGWK